MIPTPEIAAQRYAHGTNARYGLGKCRCFACRVAHTEYVRGLTAERRLPFYLKYVPASKMWDVRRYDSNRIWLRVKDRAAAVRRRDTLNGPHLHVSERSFIDPAKALQRIAELRAAGMGTPTIAERAGINRHSVLCLLSGKSKRVRQSTSDAILGIAYDAVAPGALLDAAPTWELIREILASGRSKAWIARALGRKSWKMGRERKVTRRTAEKIAALHAQALASPAKPIVHRKQAAAPKPVVVAKPVPIAKRDSRIAARWAALDLSGMARGAA